LYACKTHIWSGEGFLHIFIFYLIEGRRERGEIPPKVFVGLFV
jgi:hypothetical protein